MHIHSAVDLVKRHGIARDLLHVISLFSGAAHACKNKLIKAFDFFFCRPRQTQKAEIHRMAVVISRLDAALLHVASLYSHVIACGYEIRLLAVAIECLLKRLIQAAGNHGSGQLFGD